MGLGGTHSGTWIIIKIIHKESKQNYLFGVKYVLHILHRAGVKLAQLKMSELIYLPLTETSKSIVNKQQKIAQHRKQAR